MAEKLSPPRKRLVQSGWLLVVIIAATTLLLPLSGSHGNNVQEFPIKTQTVATPLHKSTYAMRSIPLRIKIPSIPVNSRIIQLGPEKDGSLTVPPDGSSAG